MVLAVRVGKVHSTSHWKGPDEPEWPEAPQEWVGRDGSPWLPLVGPDGGWQVPGGAGVGPGRDGHSQTPPILGGEDSQVHAPSWKGEDTHCHLPPALLSGTCSTEDQAQGEPGQSR